MKNAIVILILFLLAMACNPAKKTVADSSKPNAPVSDTVKIANDELEYEVIIIDPGFSTWLATTARPRNFYSQQYLEARNRTWVIEWNNRARRPSRNDGDLFAMPIDYQNTIDYGYEVNYLLYNYLTYFQLKNNIRLGGFVPRI